MFSKVILFFSVLSVAFAGTTGPKGSMTVEQAAQQCGNGQTISCCNSGDSTLIGLNCLAIPVLAIPINQQCAGSNVAACCKTDQDGLINVGLDCLPITV